MKTFIIGIITLLFVLTSFIFFLHEINHDCNRTDCPVCALMRTIENNFHSACTGQHPFIKTPFALPVYTVFVFIAFLFVFDKSLTGRKIRLNI